MNSILTAFRFLTLLPIPMKILPDQPSVFARSTRYFPVVGLALAALLAIAYLILSLRFSDLAVCLMLVVLLVFFTKGLHLDGLSDSFDALLSGHSREEMLAIMKDHWSGALGTAALVSVLLLKVFLLAEIPAREKIPALFLTLAGARSGMSFLLGTLDYLRGSEGLGYLFKSGLTRADWMIALAIGAVVSVISFPALGILVYGFGLLSIWLFGLWVKRKLGGVTGDILGAANEIGEVAFLLWLRIFLS